MIRLYNTAVEPDLGMKTSLTQTTTKNQLLSSIRKIMPQVSYLVNRLRGALEDLRGLANNSTNRGRVNAEYQELLRGFVTYMMILQPFNTGTLCPISRADTKHELKFYIDSITDQMSRRSSEMPT